MKKRLFLPLLLLIVFSSVKSANYYWVNNGGNWNDYNSHWATTSGGSVFYNQPPTANDDVVFDVNSFTSSSQLVNIDNGVFFCRNLTWSNVLHFPRFGDDANYNQFTTTLKVYGSISMDNSMNCGFRGLMSCESGTTTNTIKGSTTSMTLALTFNNPIGQWTLLDTLMAASIEMKAGMLVTNDKPVFVYQFQGVQNQPMSLKLGSSTLETRYWDATSPTMNLDADSATIISEYFLCRVGQTFKKLIGRTVPAGSVEIYGDDCSFDTIIADQGMRVRVHGINHNIGYLVSYLSTEIQFGHQIGYGEFHKDVNIAEGSVYDTLALFNGGHTTTFWNITPVQINNALLTSTQLCAGYINMESNNPGVQSVVNFDGLNTTISKAFIKDLMFTGTGAITASESYNNGNVTGINFLPSTGRDLYWMGGSGNWNDNTHWSLSSGGAGGACLPTQVDNVHIDQNSFSNGNDSILIPSGAACASFDASLTDDSTVIFGMSTMDELNIFGSLILSPLVSWNHQGKLTFKATTAGNVISAGSVTFQTITFSGSGSWTLQDSLRATYMFVNTGTLNTNGEVLRSYGIDITQGNNPTINLGSSIVYANSIYLGACTINGPSATMYAGWLQTGNCHVTIGTLVAYNENDNSSHWLDDFTIGTYHALDATYVLMSNCSVANAIFEDKCILGGGAISNMHFRKDFTILGNITLDSLFLENPGSAGTLQGSMSANHVQANYGSCDPYSAIYGDTTGALNPVLNVASGTVDLNNVLLRNIQAQGGATFNAYNSIDLGNVTGWIFNGSPVDTTYYWINGTGNWSNPTHWSYTSGGIPAMCVPSAISDVVFDENSFSGNDTVTADLSNIYCNSMRWQNLDDYPLFRQVNVNNSALYQLYSSSRLTIFEDLTLDRKLTNNYINPLTFSGQKEHHIKTNGIPVTTVENNSDPGVNTYLVDALRCAVFFYNYSGNLRTNNNVLSSDVNITLYDSLFAGTSILTTNSFASLANGNKMITDDATIETLNSFQGSEGNVFGKVMHGDGYLTSGGGASWIRGNDYLIKDLHIGGETEFYYTANVRLNKATVTANLLINGYGTSMGYAKIDQNLILNYNMSVDTLLLNDPGYTVKIPADSTLTINNKLYTNSTSGSNISFQSNASGAAANLICNGDTVCLEYISFQDISATGSAPIYAGQYSTDISNNTGINFTPCVLPFTDVWPGDANRDGLVDNVDMLNIALAYNETGYVRAGADLSWTAQSSQDWNRVFSNLVNIKNADSDGNGTINYLDTLAVSQNYNQTHAFVVSQNNTLEGERSASTNMFLNPTSTSVLANQLVSIPINLGTSLSPATDVYGIAYKLNYDNTHIVPGSVNITYPSSWFTPPANRLSFSKNFFGLGRMDNAQSRVDLTNASGDGTIAYLNFLVTNATTGTINIDLANIIANDRNGNSINVTGSNITLTIVGTIDVQLMEEQAEFSRIYPNPTESTIFLSYSLIQSKQVSIEIYDVLGKNVFLENYGQKSKGNHELELGIEKLPAGVYELVLYTDNKRYFKKVVKTK